MTSLRHQMRYLNPYDMHKLLINEYILKRPGDTKLLKRDTSKDRNDHHVIRDNHKFLWDEEDSTDSWELQFARRYYDKLFKEYCIADLTFYKENKVALRWRVEKEVVSGKGQFICGNKKCSEEDGLRTWEVNFGYVEQGEKKNALVKLRLCPKCSKKLNYQSKKREVKRLKKKRILPKENKSSKGNVLEDNCSATSSNSLLCEKEEEDERDIEESSDTSVLLNEESPWDKHKPVESKSRDEEMEEYLQDLLL
nr:protein FRA10AC1 [Leptinotarsa decemlineata]